MTGDTMGCPSRYLTADGRVLACEGECDSTIGDHGMFPTLSDADYRWPEDDPCAWDASCPDCHGRGWLPGLDDYDSRVCDCGGAGTVDTIPPSLIGVGSVLRIPHSPWVDWIVTTVRDGRPYGVLSLSDGVRFDHLMRDDAYELVRAVPPAHDTDTP